MDDYLLKVSDVAVNSMTAAPAIGRFQTYSTRSPKQSLNSLWQFKTVADHFDERPARWLSAPATLPT